MIFYCGGTFQDAPCGKPAQGNGESEPVSPTQCPKCGAKPIKWLRDKPAMKPLLVRLDSGWRCMTCANWVTGPFHFCVPVRNPARGRDLVRRAEDYEPLKSAIMRVSRKYQNDTGVDPNSDMFVNPDQDWSKVKIRMDVSRPELVQQQLDMIADLHRWAPWLARRADEWLRAASGPDEAKSLFIDIENTIRTYFTRNQSLIPEKEFPKFWNRQESLQQRLELGWVCLKTAWDNMVAAGDEQAQRKLVCDNETGLNHEKGYNHCLLDLQQLALGAYATTHA